MWWLVLKTIPIRKISAPKSPSMWPTGGVCSSKFLRIRNFPRNPGIRKRKAPTSVPLSAYQVAKTLRSAGKKSWPFPIFPVDKRIFILRTTQWIDTRCWECRGYVMASVWTCFQKRLHTSSTMIHRKICLKSTPGVETTGAHQWQHSIASGPELGHATLSEALVDYSSTQSTSNHCTIFNTHVIL